MTGLRHLKRGAAAAVIALTLAGAGHWAMAADAPAGAPAEMKRYSGYTEPSEKRDLSFMLQGVILEAPIKDGDQVKEGNLLMRQDDRQEKKLLEALELEATSTLEVEAAKTDLAAKEVILARKKDLFQQKVAAQSELDEAQVNRDIVAIQVKQKEFELRLKRLKAEQQAVRVEQMRLLSPISGVVQRRHLGVGEVAVPDPDKPAVTVVQNDPLNVVVYLPVEVTAKLRVGDLVKVQHQDPVAAESAATTKPAEDWRDAQVSFMDPMADAASNTQRVKLKLANAENRESGRPVKVRMPTEDEKKGRSGNQAKAD